jgi:hypothetical protein
MSGHYHLIVQTPEANLSVAMQWVNESYAIWFNRRHDRRGPLFAGRFGSVPVENGAWAYELSVYVHLNSLRLRSLGLGRWERAAAAQGVSRPPSEEQIRERLRRLRAFRWSSYRYYAGYAKPPDWLTTDELLRRAGKGTRRQRQAAYRRYAQERLSEGAPSPVLEALRDRIAVGSAQFVDQVKGLLKDADRECAGKRQLRRRVTPEQVIEAVARMKGGGWQLADARRGDWGKPLILWGLREYGGLTLREIGQQAGGMDYSAVGMAIKRFEGRCGRDKALAGLQRELIGMLNVET